MKYTTLNNQKLAQIPSYLNISTQNSKIIKNNTNSSRQTHTKYIYNGMKKNHRYLYDGMKKNHRYL